jgi:tRNA(Ile)-lysidine synthase TilS/MesJ
MAEFGEWNQKNATLSDLTAQKEYAISSEFIINGIKAGKLEYREGSIWGNPFLRILRSQLEAYVVAEFGADYLHKNKNKAELRKIKTEINVLRKQLKSLEDRKNTIEMSLENADKAEPHGKL